MKRSSAPDISTPLSRSAGGTHRRRRKSSSLKPICVAAVIVISILFSLGGSVIFFASRINLKSKSHDNNDETVPLSLQDRSSQLRREKKSEEVSFTINRQKRNPSNTKGVLIRTNQIDNIRIIFRPDLAGPSSIQYIIDVVEAAETEAEASNNGNNNHNYVTSCSRCNFYRAEKQLLLQGVIAQTTIPENKVTLGPCPINNYSPKLACPPHDPNCGCHGPIMTKGMVGWAGGGGGPDFFLNTFDKPVDWWEHQHTVWGQLDEQSIRNVERAYDLPAHMQGMRMLEEPINFTIELF